MMRKLKRNDLKLHVGDVLTFCDGKTRVVVGKEENVRGFKVQHNKDGASYSLKDMTYMIGSASIDRKTDIYGLWSFQGTTLRARYEWSKRGEPAPHVKKQVRRDQWMEDIRTGGALFYTEACYRFLLNLCARFNGTLEDRDAFLPVARAMRREKLEQLFFACTTEKIREEMKRQEYGRINDLNEEDRVMVLKALWTHPKSRPRIKQELAAWLRYAIAKLQAWQTTEPDLTKARFDELRQLLSLSEQEVDVLILATLVTNDVWPCADFRRASGEEKIKKRAALLGLTTPEYLKLVKATSKLSRLDCLDSDGDLNDQLMSFVSGLDDTPLAARFFKKSEAPVLPWEYFGALVDKHGAFLKRMIDGRSPKKGINILLYGEPGTGKTSFALALAHELGYEAYQIAQADDGRDDRRNASNSFRFAALQVCDGQVNSGGSLIVIDEADAILERQSRRGNVGLVATDGNSAECKGVLNDVLDTVQTPCVWIANLCAEHLDPSNRRRFDYSIRFDKLTKSQRETIWGNGLARYDLVQAVPESLTARLVTRYEVNAGGIDLALRNLSAMLKSGAAKPEEAGPVLDNILASHAQLLNIEADEVCASEADYALEGLSIRGEFSLPQIEHAVRKFQEEQRNALQRGRDKPRMNLLLSGPSGTGKTEFVRYLGRALDTPVIIKMGGDLLDRYVGGTERNIQSAFAEAEAEKAILFLDEAEGIIQSREKAARSWEVTQVNEVLHRMENFDGVFICATNFAENLDPAVSRRFTFKLTFDYLTEAGKRLFFARLFGPLAVGDLTVEETGRLQRISNLTPGDFRTVRQSFHYVDAAMTASRLLDALARESAAKKDSAQRQPIGFHSGAFACVSQ